MGTTIDVALTPTCPPPLSLQASLQAWTWPLTYRSTGPFTLIFPSPVSAGVTAGMDMAVDVARLSFGKERAAWAARRAEYEAHDDASWDPFGNEEAEDPQV